MTDIKISKAGSIVNVDLLPLFFRAGIIKTICTLQTNIKFKNIWHNKQFFGMLELNLDKKRNGWLKC